MITNKALYWIALAAVTFGLSSEYQRGFPCLHDLANCARTHVAGLSGRAENAILAASLITGSWRASSDKRVMAVEAAQLQHDMARRQAELNRSMAERQAEINRAVALHQAAVARAEARIEVVQAALQRSGLRHMHMFETTGFKMTSDSDHSFVMVCPKTGRQIRIDVPDIGDVQVDVPKVEVGEQF
jgi:hypothetical protein